MSANLMSLAQSGGKFLKLFGDRKMMKQLPYDAEVEYLESTGTQWIDTGVTMTNDLFDSAETTITVLPTGQTSGTHNFFGDGTAWHDGYTFGYYSNYTLQASNGFKATQGPIKFSGTLPKTLTVNKNGFAIDSEVASFNARSLKNTSGTLLLFGCRRNGVFFTTTQFSGRIYLAKMVSKGVSIFDFIPIRKDGVGYMYDNITGQLFGNQGTGAFIIGPDKTI